MIAVLNLKKSLTNSQITAAYEKSEYRYMKIDIHFITISHKIYASETSENRYTLYIRIYIYIYMYII